MTFALVFIAVIMLTCVLLNNATSRVGVPVLLAFLLLGMFVGNVELFHVHFEDFPIASNVCSAALILIMFYGGFGTRWSSARKVARESALLATVGVILTAVFTGLACHYLLKRDWLESFLIGSVISSTDAASVFSILRSRKLGLKNGTASLLEVESGANDPCSYLLTIVMLALMKEGITGWKVFLILSGQLVIGTVLGLVIAMAATAAMRRIPFSSGFDSMFLIAVALLSYALPDMIGGNGYLSAYIVGMVLGNQNFKQKRELVHFFDGFTSLMQVLIFFILGLLARPGLLWKSVLLSVALFFILLLVARPLAVGIVLTPFRKYGFRQQLLISFCGLRGASSIVFAILACIGMENSWNDLFSVTFCVVLLSISLQGTLLPYVARKLNQIDLQENVMSTFSDFSDEVDLQFSGVSINKGNDWIGKRICDLGLPTDFLICLVSRVDGTRVVPNGHTVLQEGDEMVICSKSYRGSYKINLLIRSLSPTSKWDGRPVKDLPSHNKAQLVLIMRDGRSIIPNGNTILKGNDTLYINKNF